MNVEFESGDQITLEEIWSSTHKRECYEWITYGNFKNVCLEFPENYLNLSTTIVQDIKQNFNDVKLYIVADAPYGNCSSDEISAAHVNKVDGIIHFGNKCTESISSPPVLYISPKFSFSLEKFIECLADFKEIFTKKNINIFLGIGYHHAAGEFFEKNSENSSEFCFTSILYPFSQNNLKLESIQDDPCIFFGNDENQFFNLTITLESLYWFIFQPKINTLCERDSLQKNFFRRRYFNIEKCKDASIIGIIVATLTAGYLDAVQRIQNMSKAHGIKTEIISVGRINPEKLCNFYDVDCFVIVGCPCNMLHTRKDLLKPTVSVYEAELALNPARRLLYAEKYTTDFRDILPQGSSFLEFDTQNELQNDISLINGRVRTKCISNDSLMNNSLIGMTTTISAETKKQWKGLENNLGQTEPSTIQIGLTGVPIKYNKN